jgi:hypothetical protein
MLMLYATKSVVHKNDFQSERDCYTFEKLVSDWRPFHFLKVERSTQQTYDKMLGSLKFLNRFDVLKIDTITIDQLIQHWVSDRFPKKRERQGFKKELKLLNVILRYFKERRDSKYMLPILRDHYRVYAVQKMLDHASPNETMKYVEELSDQKLKVASALNGVLVDGLKRDFRTRPSLLSHSVPQHEIANRINQ